MSSVLELCQRSAKLLFLSNSSRGRGFEHLNFNLQDSPILGASISKTHLFLTNNNRMQTEGQNSMVIINKSPMRSSNVHSMLVFEWVIFVYYLYLFTSIINSGAQYNSRILIYCIVFLLFGKLELTYREMELEDPLHLTPTMKGIRFLIYVCVFNLSIMLLRIIVENLNLNALFISMHFLVIIVLFINDFNKKASRYEIVSADNGIMNRIITPFLLFMLVKTSESAITEYVFLELMIFGGNLVLSRELVSILLLQQCHYFGWLTYQQNGKTKSNWNKRRSLHTIIIVCCISIVSQNVLLIFDKIKYEISVTIIHSFILSILAYLLYTGHLPIQE